MMDETWFVYNRNEPQDLWPGTELIEIKGSINEARAAVSLLGSNVYAFVDEYELQRILRKMNLVVVNNVVVEKDT